MAFRFHSARADKTKAIKNLENTIDRLGQAKTEIEREFVLYHEKRQRQLQAKYGISAGQDFDNLAEDNSLLLIKKEGLQRDIAELEQEKRQRLGQDASVSDIGPLDTSNPAVRFEPSWWPEDGKGRPCGCKAGGLRAGGTDKGSACHIPHVVGYGEIRFSSATLKSP